MRIHLDHEHFVHALAGCLAKDPASLQDWRCIRLEIPEQSTVSRIQLEHELNQIVYEYREADLDLLYCSDQDLFLIGRVTQQEALNTLQQQLIELYPPHDSPVVTSYDLFYNWREIRKILSDKLAPDQSPAKKLSQPAAFGDVGALHEVFANARQLRPARNPLHILLVEDDGLTRHMTEKLFKSDYAITAVPDAQQAIEHYLMRAPDIVFLDINLPDHNGFDVLRCILANDPEAYVVMFSGNDHISNIIDAIEAGASGFVAKPFKQAKMRHYIEDCDFARRKQH